MSEVKRWWHREPRVDEFHDRRGVLVVAASNYSAKERECERLRERISNLERALSLWQNAEGHLALQADRDKLAAKVERVRVLVTTAQARGWSVLSDSLDRALADEEPRCSECGKPKAGA